ncbi:MAG: hypothetical protein ACLFQR_13910 [Desulfovibrionales bacterium]
MNQETAKREIIVEWHKLPEERRQTEDQAVAFIFNLMNSRPDIFQFKYRNNPIQTILSWLLN